MFWKCPGHVLELANVGVKDELEIQSGDPERACVIVYA